MSDNNIIFEACRICGNTQDNVDYIAREMMYGLRHEFEYLECASCKCLQIKEIPKDMFLYYPKQYYSFGQYDGRKFNGFLGNIRKWKYASLVSKNLTLKKIARAISGKKDYDVFDGLNVQEDTKILDVGCGNGQNFLYPLAEVGFTNLLGCDPYLQTSISYSNGLHIQNSDVHEMVGEWDVITYHHAFEHINDPIESLNKVYDLLSIDGVCIIRIPTVSSYAWHYYSTNWVQLDAPRHFFLHSIKSMTELAKITNLELYKVHYDSSELQFRGSEKYAKNISLFDPEPKDLMSSVRRKIKKGSNKRFAKRLNKQGEGDQAAFYFRKRFTGPKATPL